MLGGASGEGNASDREHSSIRGCDIMPPVPVLKPREVLKTFGKLGWEVARQGGAVTSF